MTEVELAQLFGHFGTIISVRILYTQLDKSTKVSKGVAFVRYNTSAEASVAMARLKGVQMSGSDQPLEIREANVKYSTPFRKYVLYVVNFPLGWNGHDLGYLFGAYTPVDDVKVFTKGKGVYALVFVLGYQNALNAISALNGKLVLGRKLKVSFKSAAEC